MRHGKLGNISDEDFSFIVANSTNISDVAEKCGYRRYSGSMSILIKQRIDKLQLSTAHFNPYSHPSHQKYELDDILHNRVPYSSSKLKKRLVAEGLLLNQCAICGNPGEWQGKKLTLELDHKNGNHNDNTLDNLRLLCPNCHSQTDTFGSKRCKKTHTDNTTNTPMVKLSQMHRKNNVKEQVISQNTLQAKALFKQQKDEEIKALILNSGVDFTKYGWVTQLYNSVPKFPLKRSEITNWIQVNMPSLFEICYIYNRDRQHLYDGCTHQLCRQCGCVLPGKSLRKTGLCATCYRQLNQKHQL